MDRAVHLKCKPFPEQSPRAWVVGLEGLQKRTCQSLGPVCHSMALLRLRQSTSRMCGQNPQVFCSLLNKYCLHRNQPRAHCGSSRREQAPGDGEALTPLQQEQGRIQYAICLRDAPSAPQAGRAAGGSSFSQHSSRAGPTQPFLC